MPSNNRRDFLKLSLKTYLAWLALSRTNIFLEDAHAQLQPVVSWRKRKPMLLTTTYAGKVYRTYNGTDISTSSQLPVVTSNNTTGTSYYDIAWNGSLYVALGGDAGGYATASVISGPWTARTLPWSDKGSFKVVVAGTKFFVLADDGIEAAISNDGLTWTSLTLPTGFSWRDVTWSGTVFCLVSTTNKSATSPDGVTWTLGNLPLTQDWMAVTWNGTVFCAAGYLSDKAATSTDGLTWTTRTLPSATEYWGKFAIRGTSIYLGGINNTIIAISSDNGVSWSQVTMPFGVMYDIASSPTLTATVTGASVYRSTNGTTFTQSLTPFSILGFSIRYVNSYLVSLGTQATSQFGIGYSTTGATGTWTTVTIPHLRSQGRYDMIARTSNKYCAITNNNNVSAVSTNGITWTQGTLPSSSNWKVLQANNTTFVAVVSGSTAAATSTDGLTWTARTLPASAAWIDMAWNGSIFCLIANGGTVNLTSSDGITWTSRTIPVGTWTKIIWNGSLFCVVGTSTATCLTSTDGITWTARTLPVSDNWNAIVWTGQKFFAIAQYGATAISSDGITWTAGGTIPSFPNISCAYWNGAEVMAFGNYTVAISSDGLSWGYLPYTAGYITYIMSGVFVF